MYVKYGSFSFEPWEAGLSVHAEFVRSSHMLKHIQMVRYNIVGELVEEGEYDVNTRLDQIINAFSIEDQSCGLYHTNDSTTVHFLDTNHPNSLTGNIVYHKRLPETKDGEFVTGRQFEIGVGAYLLDAEEEILEHHDTLRRTSNAGAQWRWRKNRFWAHYPELVSPSTMQIIHHSGFRVGATAWPLPITPFYSPPFEANHLRDVTFHSPRVFKKGYTGFKTSWSYTYTLPTFDDITLPSLV
jgi:hypothetical protein